MAKIKQLREWADSNMCLSVCKDDVFIHFLTPHFLMIIYKLKARSHRQENRESFLYKFIDKKIVQLCKKETSCKIIKDSCKIDHQRFLQDHQRFLTRKLYELAIFSHYENAMHLVYKSRY